MTSATHPASVIPDIASRRILRLALGTALCMGFSQIINWPMAYMAAVFTMFILAVPLPAPTLKSGLKFVLAMVIPAYAGMFLVPFLEYARWSGILLVILALFGSFYYTARGGSPVMGMFMTLGITMVVTVGSVSAEIMFMVVNGLAVGAAAGIAFVAIAHALLPDLPPPQGAATANKPGPAPKPPMASSRRNALRSLMVVLPLVIIFLFLSSSTSYAVVMIKVASMGQQANSQASRSMGREQIESTLWGGIGAIIAFQIMSIWSSLLIFCLLIGLAGLIYGKRIFKGAGMHPKAGMWSYALLTMIIVITPAVTSTDSSAATEFYTRLGLFISIAIYGTVAVTIFDTFWPNNTRQGLN